MTTRTASGSTYTLGYDAENRLTSVSGAATAAFTYDGDGNRVKSVIGSTTTLFVGSHYETSGGVITKYYLAGGTRVAMRKGSTSFYWLLSDHLGSTSKVATSTGTLHSQQLYKAWGETRYTSGTLPTRYTYTGQYSYANDFGLVFYGARFYDAYLSHFVQPDSIIPNPYNPLDWNRYSYCRNNPVRFVDPTGHWTEDELNEALGKDWRDKYFGRKAVFENRNKLLEFLLSKNTTDPITLEIVRSLFNVANAAHGAGVDISGVDALGARVTFSTGVGGVVGIRVM